MRKNIAIVFALLMMMSAAGFSQTFGNVFVGYSLKYGGTGFTNSGTLNGWEGSLEGKVVPYVGMVADFSQQYGTLYDPYYGNVSTRVNNYLFGPRVSFPAGKFRPYAHFLIGASHLHESNYYFGVSTDTAFADAIGGGVDYHLAPRVRWRLQLDDLQTRFYSSRQDSARFSTGLVVAF